jgi:hypothetical protein
MRLILERGYDTANPNSNRRILLVDSIAQKVIPPAAQSQWALFGFNLFYASF